MSSSCMVGMGLKTGPDTCKVHMLLQCNVAKRWQNISIACKQMGLSIPNWRVGRMLCCLRNMGKQNVKTEHSVILV